MDERKSILESLPALMQGPNSILDSLPAPCVRCGHKMAHHLKEVKKLADQIAGTVSWVFEECNFNLCDCEDFALDNLAYLEQEAKKKGL